MDEKNYNAIRRALRKLGYSLRDQEPIFYIISQDRIKIKLNGEYIGIWDTQKETFVD